MAENAQYQRVKEITDKLEAGIQELFSSDQYRDWLTTMSRFHNYSLNNTILIAMQKPEATLVAGYTAWQRNFGRQVSRNEKAIKILAPAPYKKKQEREKIDPVTGEILMNPDGSMQKEVQEILMPAFKVVNVFDVSQTEGRDLPSIGVDELTGEVAQFDLFYKALEKSTPVPISYENIVSGAKGYFSPAENRIALKSDMSQVQTVKTLIHEMAHQRLHAIDPRKPDPEQPRLTRNAKEVEAESVAFTICEHFGIDTSDYSFAYIAGWSQGQDTPELKASLDRIRKTASAMITEISGHFQALQKEYAMEHLTAEDITNIQCSSSTYFPGSRMAEHQISFEALGEKLSGTYTVQQDDDGESFTFLTDGKDLWETMPDSELRKLAYALASAVEYHYWESRIDACATTGDVEEVRLSMMETEGKKITSEQSRSLVGVLENKRNDLLHNTREGQAELLSEDIVCLMYEINPLPYGVQRDAAADIAAMTQNLLSANETLAMTIGAIQDTVLLNTSEAIPMCKAVLEKIEAFLGQEHPMTQEMFGTRPEQPPQAGLQDNGQYRYYSTQRPISPGTFPKGDNKPVEIHNFDKRIPVENNTFLAWGYLEYPKPLSETQISDYELRAAPSRIVAVKEKPSVLDALRERKAEVKAQKPKQKTKQKEECR